MKVLISDNLHQAGIDILKSQPNIDVVARPGMKPEELLAEIKDADALVIRSATKVTAELMAAAPRLKVVGRAGTGLDNVDIAAASKREQEFEERHRAAVEALQEEAKKRELSLLPTRHGFALAPTHEGKLLADTNFERLPKEEREQTEARMAEMTEIIRHHIEQLPRWHKENRERVAALNREVTELATGALTEQLRQSYAEFPPVVDYLAAVREDILRNARSFLPEDGGPVPAFARTEHRPLLRYSVNLLVDHGGSTSAPVVYEDNPTHDNLVGRVEHVSHMGALTTDFTLIKAGALHRANGGYLIVDALKLLTQPFAWEGLKRALRSREIQTETLAHALGLLSTIKCSST